MLAGAGIKTGVVGDAVGLVRLVGEAVGEAGDAVGLVGARMYLRICLHHWNTCAVLPPTLQLDSRSSNFEKLYLRAHGIFFQNSKRFEEIYV